MGEDAKGVQCSFNVIESNRYKITLLTFEKDDNPNTQKYNMLAHEYDGLYRLVRKTNGTELSFEEFDLGSQMWKLKKTVGGGKNINFLEENHENDGRGFIVGNKTGDIDRDMLLTTDI